MSKDALPKTITCDDLLQSMFKYMEDWKHKLYDMMSFNSTALMNVQPPKITQVQYMHRKYCFQFYKKLDIFCIINSYSFLQSRVYILEQNINYFNFTPFDRNPKLL